MISDAKKETNGHAFLVMMLCTIIAAVAGVGGLAEINVLFLFFAMLMAIYIGIPG